MSTTKETNIYKTASRWLKRLWGQSGVVGPTLSRRTKLTWLNIDQQLDAWKMSNQLSLAECNLAYYQ
jgi:hypothetical protein